MTKEELEKEAEKYAEEKYCKGCKLRIEQCLWAWRKTNGLNEPNEKNCSCKEVPTYIVGAEFGYNKANEWHYVKDGDLPKQFGYYLVALKSIAYKGFVCEVVYFTGSIFTKEGEISDNVYAWKEIVLPELKESK